MSQVAHLTTTLAGSFYTHWRRVICCVEVP